MLRPTQFGLRALFRVTLYCAIALAILRLVSAPTFQDLAAVLLVGVLVTLPIFLVLFAVTFVGWLLE